MTISGECFCGEVTYHIEGKLRETISCHCSRCRKAFNAQASASARVNARDFSWLTGEQLLSTHLVSDDYGLQFCKNCGSTLCTIHNGEVFQVTLGCVNGDPEVVIDQHIYVGSKACWEVIPEGVKQFEKSPQ